MRRFIFIQLLLLFLLLPLYAQETGEDTNDDGEPDRWVKVTNNSVTEISLDRDFNGTVDYIIEYDELSRKTRETLDFNFDGDMDDFYIYSAGKMVKREIDSNYDGKVDIWVYLDGIYIEKYEKDVDFDGEIDLVENYLED